MNDRTGVRYISTADGGIFAVNTKSQSHNQQGRVDGRANPSTVQGKNIHEGAQPFQLNRADSKNTESDEMFKSRRRKKYENLKDLYQTLDGSEDGLERQSIEEGNDLLQGDQTREKYAADGEEAKNMENKDQSAKDKVNSRKEYEEDAYFKEMTPAFENDEEESHRKTGSDKSSQLRDTEKEKTSRTSTRNHAKDDENKDKTQEEFELEEIYNYSDFESENQGESLRTDSSMSERDQTVEEEEEYINEGQQDVDIKEENVSDLEKDEEEPERSNSSISYSDRKDEQKMTEPDSNDRIAEQENDIILEEYEEWESVQSTSPIGKKFENSEDLKETNADENNENVEEAENSNNIETEHTELIQALQQNTSSKIKDINANDINHEEQDSTKVETTNFSMEDRNEIRSWREMPEDNFETTRQNCDPDEYWETKAARTSALRRARKERKELQKNSKLQEHFLLNGLDSDFDEFGEQPLVYENTIGVDSDVRNLLQAERQFKKKEQNVVTRSNNYSRIPYFRGHQPALRTQPIYRSRQPDNSDWFAHKDWQKKDTGDLQKQNQRSNDEQRTNDKKETTKDSPHNGGAEFLESWMKNIDEKLDRLARILPIQHSTAADKTQTTSPRDRRTATLLGRRASNDSKEVPEELYRRNKHTLPVTELERRRLGPPTGTLLSKRATRQDRTISQTSAAPGHFLPDLSPPNKSYRNARGAVQSEMMTRSQYPVKSNVNQRTLADGSRPRNMAAGRGNSQRLRILVPWR